LLPLLLWRRGLGRGGLFKRAFPLSHRMGEGRSEGQSVGGIKLRQGVSRRCHQLQSLLKEASSPQPSPPKEEREKPKGFQPLRQASHHCTRALSSPSPPLEERVGERRPLRALPATGGTDEMRRMRGCALFSPFRVIQSL